jgi:hypothetical protein
MTAEQNYRLFREIETNRKFIFDGLPAKPETALSGRDTNRAVVRYAALP